MKNLFLKLKRFSGLAYGSAFAFMLSAVVPVSARADAITDSIKSFDTTNIYAAGAAIITLVITVVGIRYVIRMLKGS